MKIHIYDQGDHSVGIGNNEMTAEVNFEPTDKNDREELRKLFTDFAKGSLDFCNGRIVAYFDDECPDCLSLLKDGKCLKKNCMPTLCEDYVK